MKISTARFYSKLLLFIVVVSYGLSVLDPGTGLSGVGLSIAIMSGFMAFLLFFISSLRKRNGASDNDDFFPN